MATTSTVFILTKEMFGEGKPEKEGEDPWECRIFKGDLVVEIPVKDRLLSKEGKPLNYQLLTGPDIVTLHAEDTEVLPLHEDEIPYLLAVQPAGVRLKEYLREEKKKEIMALKLEDIVIFKLDLGQNSASNIIHGKIRYIGPVQESDGIFFGIEITEDNYRGRGNTNGRPHFQCSDNNGVFVAMDRILKKSTFYSNIEHQTTPKEHARSHLEQDTLEKLAQRFQGGLDIDHDKPTSKLTTTEYKFKNGNRVVLQSIKERPIMGTVRWVAPIRLSREIGSPQVIAVGVETDEKIKVHEEFPDLSLDLTGSHGQNLFTISSGHSRVYLPEQLVLHVNEYKLEQQKENELNTKLAKEYCASVEEYRAQKDLLNEAKQTINIDHDKKIGHHKNLDRMPSDQSEKGLIAATGITGEDHRQMEESVYLLQTGQTFSDVRIEHEQQCLEEFQKQQRESHPKPNDSKLVQSLKEQLTQQEREFKNERAKLLQTIHEFQTSNDTLRSKITLIEKEKRDSEQAQQHIQREKQQLEKEKWDLQRKIQASHTQLQRDKDQFESELQGQVARLTVENMRLKGQVKQLEENSVADINYWEVSHVQVKSNKIILGEGGWGKVQVGLLQGQKVALKMLHSEIVSPYYNQLVRREISMMAKVRHPNLLLFIAAVLDHPSGSPIIITELLDTSLRKAYKDGMLSNNQIKLCLLRDVAAALNYLHRHKDQIIHRDVSSANVLLESKGHNNWKGKLSDFGSANLVQFSMTTGPGAQVYAAPEVPQTQTPKMDVYSYGILLCEVLTNQFPFRQTFPAMLQSLASSWSLMYQIIMSCTKSLPADRPDMEHILQTFYDKFSSILMTELNDFTDI